MLPRRAAEGDHALHEHDVGGERLVDRGLVHRGPRVEVHGVGRAQQLAGDEVAIHRLRDERRERREQPHDGGQALVQRVQRGLRVGGVIRLPEAATAAAHVPVGELLHELRDRAGGVGGLVRIEALGDALHGVM